MLSALEHSLFDFLLFRTDKWIMSGPTVGKMQSNVLFLHNKRQLGPGHRCFMIHYRIVLVDGKQMTRDTAESDVYVYESIYKSS